MAMSNQRDTQRQQTIIRPANTLRPSTPRRVVTTATIPHKTALPTYRDMAPVVTYTQSPSESSLSSSTSSLSTLDSDEYSDGEDLGPVSRHGEEDLQEGDEIFDDDEDDDYDEAAIEEEDVQQVRKSAGNAIDLSEFDIGDEYAFDDDEEDDEVEYQSTYPPSAGDSIPAVLPPYRASIVDPSVRPSTPEAFAQLFPSLDRLSVRHDEFTPDGNMNLRVDTVVHASSSSSSSSTRSSNGAPISVQLFHLRMHDLARRDFSLRRYCRDSGRELCNSKRAYVDASSPAARRGSHSLIGSSHQGIQRSVSSALRSVKTPFQKSSGSAAASIFRRPSTSHSAKSNHVDDDNASSRSSLSGRSARSADSVSSSGTAVSDSSSSKPRQMVPTEKIKLEFSNYARVDVTRLGRDKGYSFEWWGHRYVWRRVVDENLGGAVSFHLARDGDKHKGHAVAHIVPETRSPSQVEADEAAGGWIPPCHMWISDPSVLDAMTDVADVIVATGLIALVDDSIKQRWQVKKTSSWGRRPASSHASEVEDSNPRKLMQSLFHRRHSAQHSRSPLRFGHAVAAY